MSEDTQSNDTKKMGTVSIRKMDMELWYKAGYKCKVNGIRLNDYIRELIRKDLQDGENTSN